MKPIISDKTETVTKMLFLCESIYSNNHVVVENPSPDTYRVLGVATLDIHFMMYDLKAMSAQAKEVERVKLEAEIEELQKRLQELNND